MNDEKQTETAPAGFSPNDTQEVPILPYYQCNKIVQAVRISTIDVHDTHVLLQYVADGVHWIRESLSWFNKHRPMLGWYYVKYSDGYSSASPPGAFETGYIELPIAGMDYGDALKFMQQGKRVMRADWMSHSDNHYIFLLPEKTVEVFGQPQTIGPQLAAFFAGALTLYVATVADQLATDWQLVT